MRILLDTCVLSELARRSPDPKVLEWFDGLDAADLFISVLTLGEIEYGICRLPDGRKKKDIASWFAELKERFKENTIPVSPEIALAWGGIRASVQKDGSAISVVDGLLAATSIRLGLPLATRNVSDFKMIDMRTLNPWD